MQNLNVTKVNKETNLTKRIYYPPIPQDIAWLRASSLGDHLRVREYSLHLKVNDRRMNEVWKMNNERWHNMCWMNEEGSTWTNRGGRAAASFFWWRVLWASRKGSPHNIPKAPHDGSLSPPQIMMMPTMFHSRGTAPRFVLLLWEQEGTCQA